VTKQHTYDYPLPAVTLDTVIFTIRNSRLAALLIKRRDAPFKGCWAIPGGFLDVGVGHKARGKQGEDLEAGAERELKEETSLERERDNVFLEQLYTFGAPGRDPRGRVITIAYYALISPEAYHRVVAGDDAAEAEWFPIGRAGLGDGRHSAEIGVLPKMAFDHDHIMEMALERIRGKIDYDPRLARALLPQEFTAKEFKRVHEIVKGETYDSSNFRKRFARMVEDGRFIETDETKEQRGAGRPARLYRFPDDGDGVS
jgi:8-oxo-dGTP diphosphatase